MKNTPIVELSTILQRAFRAPFILFVFMAATLVACGQTGPLFLQVNDELAQQDAQTTPKDLNVKPAPGNDARSPKVTQ